MGNATIVWYRPLGRFDLDFFARQHVEQVALVQPADYRVVVRGPREWVPGFVNDRNQVAIFRLWEDANKMPTLFPINLRESSFEMAKKTSKTENKAETHQASDRSDKKPHRNKYSADAPIRSSGEDRFQRWPFAQRIAKIIATRKNPESLVIGINGAWGEGKTTVFYFIEEALRHHNNVVTIRFNPWRFPDESKLIRDFFHSLADALDKSIVTGREKVGDFIGTYISIPAAFAGAGDATKAIGDLLSSVDLEKIKDRVETILKDAGKRVVVLMDDIDRLDKSEIQTVFRLVKLVADFNNTAYVLAFDSDMVASALQERYSSHDKDAGRNFLEKIIQVPLDLPDTPRSSLRSFCLEIIQQIITEEQIELTDNDVEKFVMLFDSCLLIRLNTPRMAKRYGNILSFALPILTGEVNIVDLVALEGIRIFYPKLYDTIRDLPEIFLATHRRRGEHWEAATKETKKVVARALDTLSPAEKKAAIALVKRLFPRMEEVYGGTSYDDSYEEHWASQRLLASGTYFQRYFSYAIPEGQISDQELSAFIKGLPEKQSTAVAAELKSLIGKKNADYVIEKLRLIETVARLPGPIRDLAREIPGEHGSGPRAMTFGLPPVRLVAYFRASAMGIKPKSHGSVATVSSNRSIDESQPDRDRPILDHPCRLPRHP